MPDTDHERRQALLRAVDALMAMSIDHPSELLDATMDNLHRIARTLDVRNSTE